MDCIQITLKPNTDFDKAVKDINEAMDELDVFCYVDGREECDDIIVSGYEQEYEEEIDEALRAIDAIAETDIVPEEDEEEEDEDEEGKEEEIGDGSGDDWLSTPDYEEFLRGA